MPFFYFYPCVYFLFFLSYTLIPATQFFQPPMMNNPFGPCFLASNIDLLVRCIYIYMKPRSWRNTISISRPELHSRQLCWYLHEPVMRTRRVNGFASTVLATLLFFVSVCNCCGFYLHAHIHTHAQTWTYTHMQTHRAIFLSVSVRICGVWFGSVLVSANPSYVLNR